MNKSSTIAAVNDTPKNPISALKPYTYNPTKPGVTSSNNYTSNLFEKYAKETLGKSKTKKIKEVIPNLDTGFGKSFNDLKFSKNALMGSKTMTENIEILIEKLIEEAYMQRISKNGITPASPPMGNGEGVKPPTTQRNQLLSRYGNSVQAKVDDTRQHLTRTNDDAQGVVPGTGKPKAAYSFLNSKARELGSETNARREDRLQKQFEQQQEG